MSNDLNQNERVSMKGAIWVAWGEKHLEIAAKSARTFKQHNPECGTALFSIEDVESDAFDQVIVKPELQKLAGLATRPKVACLADTPFEKTIFFDTDTLILKNLDPAYDVLDKYDIAGCQVLLWQRPRHGERHRVDVPTLVPQINTGVLVYSSSEHTLEFMRQWNKNFEASWDDNVTCDQVSFRETLWESDLKFHVLPEQMNKRLVEPSELIYTDKPEPMVVHLPILTPAKTWHHKLRQKISEWYYMNVSPKRG